MMEGRLGRGDWDDNQWTLPCGNAELCRSGVLDLAARRICEDLSTVHPSAAPAKLVTCQRAVCELGNGVISAQEVKALVGARHRCRD
jgi:hypothetical protein